MTFHVSFSRELQEEVPLRKIQTLCGTDRKIIKFEEVLLNFSKLDYKQGRVL